MPSQREITLTAAFLRDPRGSAQIKSTVAAIESLKHGSWNNSPSTLNMASGIDDFIKAFTNVRTTKDGTYQDFLKEGNLRYKRDEFFEAATAYTRCVVLSPLKDPGRAKALASRSAVLMNVGRFEDSILDADRALEHAYPQELRFRLHLRKAQCFKELGNLTRADEEMSKTRKLIEESKATTEEQKSEILAIAERTFAGGCDVKVRRVKVEYMNPPEISHGVSENLPCLSSAVDICKNEKYGRHWVATRDLQTGDVLLKEEPAVAGLKIEAKWTHCAHCFRPSFTLYPCQTCNKDLFCNTECKNAAKNYHTVICIPRKKYEDEFQRKFDLSENIFSSFTRIFDFLAFLGLENCANYDNQSLPQTRLMTEFLNLVHHSVPYEEHIRSLCFDIIQFCFDITDREKLLKLSEFCCLALLKHNANSFSVEECFRYSRTDEFDLKHVAYGSYHVASLANHSCDPNVVCVYYGKTMVCRAIKPVKKGHQLFLRYCNLFYNLPKETRLERLSQYKFDCDCDPCTLDWPIAKLMPKDPAFSLETQTLWDLVKRESETSGLAMNYEDIKAVKTFDLAKKLQDSYFEPILQSRLDRGYKLIETAIFYHWAVNTMTYSFYPLLTNGHTNGFHHV
ncbi:SET and MYND domain-containing protein 4-like [Neocloeon triangulifer]|uniref:SET and MYND domain-containing protein 4-like n=1 Tax=Neocloeon triangulifer TaxID=2078957 RepID=UPI00286EDC40|nr:SET and MYND domain-containing protein 4-like [Neocloeon triangulifer]